MASRLTTVAIRAGRGSMNCSPRTALGWVTCLVIICNTRCGPDLTYLPLLAAGQLAVLEGSVTIEEAITSKELSDQEIAKLRLIQDVRRYAVDNMSLVAGDSFTLFYDNRNATRSYNVSASRKDSLAPVTWTFPIVGALPYLGFFDRARADRQAELLGDEGFDVFTYEVDAYSTLGYLPNPVRATMLRRSDISIVSTVIHEILHDTIWRPGDVTFNESLATFFGRTGAMGYLRDRFDNAPELIEAALDRFEDIDRYNSFILELFEELEAYYESDAAGNEKIEGRERVFQSARDRFLTELQPLMNVPENYDWIENLPTNNAWILGNYRYNRDLDLFRNVYDASGGDWRRSLAVFQAASDAEDPKANMRDWLVSNFREPT